MVNHHLNFLYFFSRSVRLFYEKVVKKMIATFPFNYTILQDLAFLNQENRCKLSSDCGKSISN